VAQKVSTWLNRVLTMTLEDQELLFRYFSDTHDATILAAKSRGEYDQVGSLFAPSTFISHPHCSSTTFLRVWSAWSGLSFVNPNPSPRPIVV